jgi:cell wall-associated NlpC family hydrolase
VEPVSALLTAFRYRKPLMWIALGLAVLGLMGGLAVVALFMTAVGGSGAGAGTCANSQAAMAPASAQAPMGSWSAEQMTNAATIVEVGRTDHVPVYGQVIAIATAMQETSLMNLPYGDRDSLGLFQQRPSQGWGTPQQILDPVYASNQFYKALLAVPGWQQLPLTAAAQDVQHSGSPGAYAQWQGQATAVVTHLTGSTVTLAAAYQPGGCAQGSGATLASAQQMQAVLDYAYGALGTMYQFGGSCTDPHSPDMALHCDCSSLVQQAFAKAGLQLPRTAAEQAAWGEAGHAQVIPYGQEQIGDVVYFPTDLGPDVIGHTGIVVDPVAHLMIAAPHTGAPVTFESYVPTPPGVPYGTHLFTILRFLNATGSSI